MKRPAQGEDLPVDKIEPNRIKPYKIKIPHRVIIKTSSLLPMLYKVSELAYELDIPERTLRDWYLRGAPHQRDSKNHVWINGIDFAKWINSQRKKRNRQKLSNTQAYCMRCNNVVEMENIKSIHIKGKLVHFRGICPQCGVTINRGGCIE